MFLRGLVQDDYGFFVVVWLKEVGDFHLSQVSKSFRVRVRDFSYWKFFEVFLELGLFPPSVWSEREKRYSEEMIIT